jgi:hypothetical protein
MKKFMLMTVLFMVGTVVLSAADLYTNEVRSTANRSYATFRIQKSDGSVQCLRNINIPLLSGWVATTTAALLATTNTIVNAPYAALTSSTGITEIAIKDGGVLSSGIVKSAAIVYQLKVPEDYVTGSDLNLLVNVHAHTNTASRAYLMTQVGVNGSALTNAVATACTLVGSTLYGEHVIDLSDYDRISTLAPGDNLAIALSRAELVSAAATGTVSISGINLLYNKNILHSR